MEIFIWIFSVGPGFSAKSLPVKYSFFSNLPDNNAEILAAFVLLDTL